MKKLYTLILTMLVMSTLPSAAQLVELPHGAVPEEYTLRAVQYNSTPSGWQQTLREENIFVAFVGDDVYVRGLACWFRESYVRGHFNDAGDIVFASGQYVGSDDYGPEYLIGLLVPTNDGDDYTLTDYIFKFDEEERTLTLDVSCIIGESGASNLTDQLYDYIDTAVLSPGKLPLPPTVELPTGVETETWYLSAMQDGNQVIRSLSVGFDGDDVYVQGLCEYLPHAWVKGFMNSNERATFESGQFYGQVEGTNLYFLGYDGFQVKDVEFRMNREQGWMATEDFVVLNASDSEFDPFIYYSEVELSRSVPQPNVLVEVPNGLSSEEYLLTAKNNIYNEGDPKKGIPAGYEQEDYSATVRIAFDGKDVYIQGLSSDCPDGWAKGTLSNDGGSVTLPCGQYLGSFQSTYSLYPYYLVATDAEGNFADLRFSYNAQTHTLSSEQDIYINASRLYLNYYYWFTDMVMQAAPDVAATPAMPLFKNFVFTGTNNPYVEVRIPSYDTNGTIISQSKLSYQFLTSIDEDVQPLVFTSFDYVDMQEDMVEIPYTFGREWRYDFYDNYSNTDDKTVYLHFPDEDVRTWQLLGVQSIYRGGGEVHKSEIAWYDVEAYFELNGINSVQSLEKAAQIHDLQGRRLQAEPQRGIYIIGAKKVIR